MVKQATSRATPVSANPWPSPPRARFAWFRDHARVATESFGYLSGRLATSLLVWLLIGIALALPAGLFLLQKNLANLTGDWQGRPGVSVYFERGVSTAAVEAVIAKAEAAAPVQKVWHITPEQALQEFQEFSGLNDSLDLLAGNPLPNSLKVTLAGSADVLALQDVATSLVNRLGMVLGVMFALGAVLVTATSVRLAIEARLDELRVQKLVGASNAFLRRPFLYFGLLYGLGGALIALMLLSAVLLVLEAPLAALLGSYGNTLNIIGFDSGFLLGLLLLGGVLGLFGAILASQQRLGAVEVV